MNKDIDYLASLYKKIIDNSASEHDKINYELGIKKSCIKEEVLIEIIKERANTI